MKKAKLIENEKVTLFCLLTIMLIRSQILNILLILQINHIRNQNHINVSGENVPPPIQTFEDLAELYNVSPQIIENIKSCGYATPTPIQMQAVPAMLNVRSQ